MEKRRSNRGCCVTNCTNSEKKCAGNLNIKFYSFPGKYYEEERKQKWIIAVNRKNPDGSLWQPTASSRICSEHFAGGRKSDKVLDPGYIPSIFPALKITPKIKVEDFEKVKQMKKIRKVYSIKTFKQKLTDNVQTQVNFDFDRSEFIFASTPDEWINKNNKIIQCNIGYNICYCKPTKDQSCGPTGSLLTDALFRVNLKKQKIQ